MPNRRDAHPPVEPAAADWQEWQEQQYSPGYYTGGRIPPFLRGARPNRYGCVLLVSGLGAAAMIMLAAGVSLLTRSGSSLLVFLIPAMLTVLLTVAGLRLLRAPRRAPQE